ncbi:MAG TPA: hypothetical protein VMV77_00820 [Bacteroidales bacterium]|nr:hypothetical protein [Bacteroidales bacterium]
MFRKSIIITLLFVSIKLSGQSTESFRYIDSLTYNQYAEKRWNDLIRTGNHSVKNGHDYYYMRMRIGIAYYEKHNYYKSANHFRKALEFNEKDQVALEYLFYSYYFSGRTPLAWDLISSFFPQNRERILDESKIKKNSMTVESFFNDSGTDKIISEPESYFSDIETGNQIVTKYFMNNALYASHVVGKNASYFHSYTNLIKENYLNYLDGSVSAHLDPQRVVQNQYYGSFNFFSSKGWVVSPSLHLLTVGYPIISITTTGMNHSARTYNVRSNGLHVGLAVSKSFGFIGVGAETGYFVYNSTKNWQGTFSLMAYPLGNNNIYFGAKLSTGKELNMVSSDLKIVKGFTAGFSIGRKIWFEFSGLTGDLINYTDNNGLYIYNSLDILKNKLTGRIIIPFNKAGITIFAGGGISSYSSELLSEDGIISYGTNKLNYNSNNFTGGISWNF